jgi:hypothetical protein
VIEAAKFELVEMLTRETLRQHPVWSHFEEPRDRERVLAWGVAPERLDEQLGRFDFCGLEPLYPVLELDPLPKDRDLIVSVRFSAPCGIELEGYLLDPHAFGVFAGEREHSFNRSLPRFAERGARQLAQELGRELEELFPLEYATELRSRDGSPIRGRIEPCW